MTFASPQIRLAQTRSAEDLLHTVDPSKAYPTDFIVFRITGYRPKTAQRDLITGLALQHDLGLLIETISETMDLHTAELREPVLAIDDVTEKFNVTSKTIQRWRRRGLPARRFIFPDGRRRVGFLLSSVERFLSTHSEQVQHGANFSQITEHEREVILSHAQRLATRCDCCVNEIARRIGRKLDRSPLTILHTIRKHDAEHPTNTILPLATSQIDEDQSARVLRGYRKGLTLTQLARRIDRPRSAVYRVIIDERIARLSRRKVKFIDDALYHQRDAASVIEQIVAQEPLSPISSAEERRIPRDLPPYLQDLYRTPLLSPQQERSAFLKFNFHKYQFVLARRRLEPQFARARDLNVLEGHLCAAVDTKNAIVRANLRLVVSIARKHLRPMAGASSPGLMEMISDGNLTLMRAVESFDTHKGNRFSTYATLALMKGFARSVPLMHAERMGLKRLIAGTRREALQPEMPDTRVEPASRQISLRDEVQSLFSRLDGRERAVLAAHFGIADNLNGSGSTYESLSERFGLSTQRLRQIERTALEKLRAIAKR